MDRKEIFAQINNDLAERNQWEQKQRIWYEMRHDGLPRGSKPWLGAADLHYPLADELIRKLKPFYFKQIFSSEVLASFTARKKDLISSSVYCSRFFTYKANYRSNFKETSVMFIDKMLQGGTEVVKLLYNASKEYYEFEAIDPLNIIVPRYTEDIEDADYVCHVIPMSVDAYKRNKLYNQDKDFIKTLTGETKINDTANLEETKYSREGFTKNRDKNQVIVWEVYQKDEDGCWVVDTFSPRNTNTPVREPFKLSKAYKGLPFVVFKNEIKDAEFYSARGIPEMVAMHETYLTKQMNEKSDSMTLLNRPLFSSNNPLPNNDNIVASPGKVIPGVTAITMPAPPMSFDQEMQNVRQMAEARVGTPDFGIMNQQPTMGSRTKYEVQQAVGFSSMNIELDGTVFRWSLARLYQKFWSLILENEKENLEYCYNQEFQQMDSNILVDAYQIEPSGSIDCFNRELIYQKNMMLYQMFANNPLIDQEQLIKNILESLEPAYVNKLLLSPESAEGNQVEEQAKENVLIEQQGIAPVIMPTDNHETHIKTMIQRLQAMLMQGMLLNQRAAELYVQHFAQHLSLFKQQKGKQAPIANEYQQAFNIILSKLMEVNSGQISNQGVPITQ